MKVVGVAHTWIMIQTLKKSQEGIALTKDEGSGSGTHMDHDTDTEEESGGDSIDKG